MDLLGDRFSIEREIGRGGMGTVYLAHDNHLSRRVAVKVLPEGLSATIGAERFVREIRVTARLVHPSIVPLFDSGSMNDRLYYVMPFVDGPTLKAHIAASGTLSVNETLSIARDVAEALSYAHAQGVVHRDIKPENIFCYGGRALLADFGIAKISATEVNSSLVTNVGEIVGTLTYISPEQGTGEDVDARSDLYSLGCVLYEMLVGEPPYVANSPMAVLAKHMTSPIPDASTRNAAVPESLAHLLSELMAKSPNDRPKNAAALINRLHTINSPAPARTPVANDSARRKYTAESMAAVDEGMAYWLRGIQGGPSSRDKLELAQICFNRARALDPNNSLALVGLSDTVHVMGYRGFRDYGEAAAEARSLRYQALATDDTVAEVHASIGVSMMYWEDDFEGAGREFSRARELGPDVSIVRRFCGTWLKIAGRTEEAVTELRIAVELAPDIAAQHNALGDVLITAGRFEEAIPHLRAALRLSPQYSAALERLEIACHRGGRTEEALSARRAWLGQRKLPERVRTLEENVARLGWNAARELDLRSELALLLDNATHENPFGENGTSRQLADQIITTYAELGEYRSVMDWVERSYLARPGRLRRVLTDFLFDHRGLAVDPRYAPLLRTAGLQDLLDDHAHMRADGQSSSSL
ncbi:MAG TPA: serine/threonine-protein kinase [Gemmatimonadaceae bacterium]|nr:serine/threonine-protein kinase [Gemmatimonadaceae bacterium]